MNPFIEQFEKDVKEFAKQFSNCLQGAIFTPIEPNKTQIWAGDAIKSHITQSSLNLVDKMIEECEERKIPPINDEKYFEKGDVMKKLRASKTNDPRINAGIEIGYNSALSDTISQLQEFKNYLLTKLNK